MTQITVEQLKARMDKGEKLNLIDCREAHEYEEVNLGARLIPLGKFQMMDLDEMENLKEEEVIIHCRSGKRSMMACQILDQMGYKNTVNVEGGILDWVQKYGQPS